MSLDDQVDGLFTVPPERFTSARDELARRLAKDGDKAAADDVKALRKPTLVAWALNQIPRRFGDDLEALLETGEALRAAQRKAASGLKDSGFQEATERRRKAVRDLTAKAAGVLSEAGKPSQTAEADIGRTLEAASVDPEAGQQLVQGRLAKPISTVPGFDSVGGFEVIAGGGKEAEDARRAERSAAQTALRNAERQTRKAETDAQRARMRADTLKEEAAELSHRAEVAAREAEELEEAATEAREKLQRAQREAGS